MPLDDPPLLPLIAFPFSPSLSTCGPPARHLIYPHATAADAAAITVILSAADAASATATASGIATSRAA